MHYFQEVFQILKKAKSFGEDTARSGATLFGKVPHIGSEAWFHTLYLPLSEREIDELEGEMNVEFPESYREFLELTNGIRVFSNSLSIFGRRDSFSRSVEDRQPYSVVSENYNRPVGMPKKAVLIGFYPFRNGFYLYIECNSGKVIRCRKKEAKPLVVWDSFGQMLLSEVRRLEGFFDDIGRRRDQRAILVPDDEGNLGVST